MPRAGVRKSEPCMASKRFGLQKPPHPRPIRGGSSNGLVYREPLAQNRRSRSSPIRAAKNWKQKMMKPQVLRGTAAFVAEMLLRTPIPATPFFDVGLRKSIAAGISAGQAGWAACFHMSYWVTRARLLILNFDQVCFVASSCASFFSIHASNFLPSDTDTSLYSCSKIFMQSSIYS